MSRPPPKPRAARRSPTDGEAPPGRQPSSDAVFVPETTDHGHPLFGFAPVVMISVEQIRYRGRVPVPLERGRHDPRDLFDATSVRERCGGGGRFRLKPLGANGRSVLPPIELDCPDENGVMDLVAPMPDDGGAAAAPAAAPAAAAHAVIDSRWETLLREMMADTRSRSKEDMASFTSLVTTILGAQGAGGGAGAAGTFYESELRLCRAELADVRGKFERLQAENLRLKTATTDDGFLKEVVRVGAERFGFAGPPRGPAAPAAGASPTDGAAGVGVPSASQFREYVKGGGQVDRGTLERMVSLRAVGALEDEMWSIVRVLAQQIGVPTGESTGAAASA